MDELNSDMSSPLGEPRPLGVEDAIVIKMTAQPTNTTNTFSKEINTLADILLKQGSITQEQARQIKFTEIQTGKTQEEVVLEQNFISEDDLVRAKSTLYNIPYLDLDSAPNSPEAISILPHQVAQRFRVFPISIDKIQKVLSIAMADPLDLTAIGFIEQKTGFRVKPFASQPSKIDSSVSNAYSSSLAKEVTEALKEVAPDKKRVEIMDTSRTGVIREEKVSEIVRHILSFSVKSRASDIHIEPQEKSTRVRYRIDGILQEKLTTPRELHDSLVSRVKILSGMKIDEKRIPQDGRFNFNSDNEEVDLRVSTLPTTWGEKIVIRLLKKTGGIPDLPDLGLRGRALKNLEDAIIRPHGIVLITGPTGSGKTTTLYSIIQRINTQKINIVTLEDPIEYKIAGVNQVQVNPGAGLTFASGLRSFLRQDPNVILVGEIRDQETADLAVQAALTGHLVFSTLHTTDSSGALPRMLDMGAEPYLLASSITAIMAQRVLRKIHMECRIEYIPEVKIINQIRETLGNLWKPSGQIKFYKGEGCTECGNTGYHGRVGVFEVLPITEKISRLILERATSGDIESMAKEEGMITMKQDGYMKVVEGITSIEEVLRVAQE